MKWIPKLNEWKNELVVWIGIVTTVGGEVILYLEDNEFTDLNSILIAVPAAVSLIQRQFAWGNETVKTIQKDTTMQVLAELAERDEV